MVRPPEFNAEKNLPETSQETAAELEKKVFVSGMGG
jgi:hypothetical protein